MAKTKRTDLLWVPLADLLFIETRNNRIDYGDLQELSRSILINGVKTPLRVEKVKGTDKYAVVDGHRRYKAIEILVNLGHEVIVPIIRERNNTPFDILLTQIVSNQSKPFGIYEQSRVYDKMRALGNSPKTISEAVGKSITQVTDCLLIADAPEGLRLKIEDGTLSATLVIQQIKKSSAEQVEEELNTLIEEKGGAKITKKDLKKNPNDIKLSVQDLINLTDELQELSEDEGIEIKEDAILALRCLATFYKDKEDPRTLFTKLMVE